MEKYRSVLTSSFGTGRIEIQTKNSFLGIKYWERFHCIYMDDGDAETAIRKANKMIRELENEKTK
tara:strand:- start:182 stop:376 length:195 start_codon:yes stop_codon:yes gene_type:complete